MVTVMRRVERVETSVMFLTVKDNSAEIGGAGIVWSPCLAPCEVAGFSAYSTTQVTTAAASRSATAMKLAVSAWTRVSSLAARSFAPQCAARNQRPMRTSHRPSRSCSTRLTGTGLGRAWSTTGATTGSIF